MQEISTACRQRRETAVPFDDRELQFAVSVAPSSCRACVVVFTWTGNCRRRFPGPTTRTRTRLLRRPTLPVNDKQTKVTAPTPATTCEAGKRNALTFFLFNLLTRLRRLLAAQRAGACPARSRATTVRTLARLGKDSFWCHAKRSSQSWR